MRIGVAGKKIAVLLLSFCLMLSIVGTAAAATDSAGANQKPVGADVVGHWSEKVMKGWADKGYIKGFRDGSLKPDQTVTRAEFASFVNRAYAYSEEAGIAFKDVSSTAWYYADVAKAQAAGYINGYQDQTFKPNKTITRVEAAIMISRIGKLKQAAGAGALKDTAGISSQGRAAIAAVIADGLMSASGGKFRPHDGLTRAEAVTVIDRIVAKSAVKQPVYEATYDKAGVYGSKSQTTTVKGSVAVTAGGVTLNNMVIEGDLLLAESIGEGDVYLNQVTVKGKTTINGGGKNSIHLQDSVVLTVIVNKKDGSIRIVAEGSTTVEEITLQSGARLVESNLTGSGFGDLILSQAIPANANVELSGRFETVDVIATSLNINLESGAIAELLVGQSAGNTNLEIGNGADVASLVLNAIAKVTGQGSIGTATINASGATIAQTPGRVVVADNVEATVNGRTAATTGTNSNTGSSSSGSNGGGSPTVYGFAGTIIDAQGNPVAGAKIKFRRGVNNETGDVVATAETNERGYYVVQVAPGVYLGEIIKEGYLTTFVVGVSLSAGGYNPGQDATAVTIPKSGEIRIVLVWGENPRDEDSHLLGPTPAGSGFHTWYGDKVHRYNGEVYADLDIDDVTSYGPETTTIRQRVNGTYQFYVHHFSGISTLRQSNARVEVYVGSETTPSATYAIPTGEGTEIYWNVFEMTIDGASVTFAEKNEMTNTPPTPKYAEAISKTPQQGDIYYENNYGAQDVLRVKNLSAGDVVYADVGEYRHTSYTVAEGETAAEFDPMDFGEGASTIRISVKSVNKEISPVLYYDISSEANYAAEQANKFVDFTLDAYTSVTDTVYLKANGALGSKTDFTIKSITPPVSVTDATYLEVTGEGNGYLKLNNYNTTGSDLQYEVEIEVSVSGKNKTTKTVSVTIPTVESALEDMLLFAGSRQATVNNAALAAKIADAESVQSNPASTVQEYIDALTELIAAYRAAAPIGG